MKNMMRRTVAFMLMACLLLSVIAPAGMLRAEAVTTVGNDTTYSITVADGTTWRSGEIVLGDLTGVGKGSSYSAIKVKNNATKGLGIQCNLFSDSDTTDNTVTRWVALKFTAENSGAQQLSFVTNGQTSEKAPYVCVVTADAWDASEKNDAYVYGLTPLGRTSGDVRYTFTANEEYVVIFKPAENTASANTTFYNMTLTLPSFVGEKGSYFTVAEAVAAEETAISLNSDFAGDVTLTDGISLDLNGKKVTGNVIAADGELTDSVGTAEITGTVNVPATNEQIVVKAGDVSKLISYTAKQNGYKRVGDTIEFWFDADFAEDAYALLTAQNGVTINAVLKANDKEVTVDMSGKIADWIANKGLYEGQNAGLGISVTGFKAGDVITVTPVFATEAGNAGVFGNAITYTVPNA